VKTFRRYRGSGIEPMPATLNCCENRVAIPGDRRYVERIMKILGHSDMEITPVGFGSWAAGGPWKFGWGEQDDASSIAAIHKALELGINWIDTAPAYGLGHSEEIVARALADWSGEKPYVFTKCGIIWNDKREVDYSLRPTRCGASARPAWLG
jgi:aryl-alcohol dehydrogenase-like predicted oxidoreductase